MAWLYRALRMSATGSQFPTAMPIASLGSPGHTRDPPRVNRRGGGARSAHQRAQYRVLQQPQEGPQQPGDEIGVFDANGVLESCIPDDGCTDAQYGAIRFSSSQAWSYDEWAGLGYTRIGTTGLVKLGGPAFFKNNSSPDTSNVAISATDSTMIYLKSDGNVGIGTDNPLALLHVKGSNAGVLKLETTSTAAGGRCQIDFVTSGSNWELGARGSDGNPDNSFYIYDQTNAAYRFYIASNGNVGLGNTSATEKLSVSGNINASGKFINNQTAFAANQNNEVFVCQTSNSTDIRQLSLNHKSDSGGVFRFGVDYKGTSSAAATELLSIVGNGKIGIGTDSPAERLHVYDTTNSTMRIGNNEAGSLEIKSWSEYGTTLTVNQQNSKYLTSAGATQIDMNKDYIKFQTAASGTANATISWSERMRIKNNGYVGIGDTTPDYKLDVGSNDTSNIQLRVKNSGSGRAGIQINNGSDSLHIQQNGTTALIENYGSGGMNFYQKGTGNYYFKTTDSNTDRLVIANNGNVGIGTNNPAALLHVPDWIYAYGTYRKIVIDLSGQPSDKFYPIVLENGVGGFTHQFILNRAAQVNAASHNDHLLWGTARGGGWSDRRPFVEVQRSVYDIGEESVLGIYEGSKDYMGGIAIYVRGGGAVYHLYTNSYTAGVHTNGTTTFGGSGGNASIFAIKNGSKTDVIGTSQNITEIYDGMVNNTNEQKYFSSDINVNGNLGVGNHNPAYKLDVSGDINLTGSLRINGTAQTFGGSSWDYNVVNNKIDLYGSSYQNNTGIYYWGKADTNWGTYMATSGANKSFSD